MREGLFHVIDRERIGRAPHHRGEYGAWSQKLHVYDNGESVSITYEGPQGEICTAAVIQGDDLGRFVGVINAINDRRLDAKRLADARAIVAEAEAAETRTATALADARSAFRVASNDRDSAYAAYETAARYLRDCRTELDSLKSKVG